MKSIKMPKSYKSRLKAAASSNEFASADALFEHLITRGLANYNEAADAESELEKIQVVVDERGYSSPEEVIEHLVERGLTAYENSDGLDRDAFEARLRGLGYID